MSEATKADRPLPVLSSDGLGPTPPAAAHMRLRYVTTWARAAVDGKDHFSEWSDWMPTTYAHAKACTDPARNSDPTLYEMRPLYDRPARALTETQIQELCCVVDASGERPAATALIRAVERAHGIGA